MSRFAIGTVAATSVIVGLFSVSLIAQTNPQSVWPMTGHDPQRTGLSSFVGPVVAPSRPAWTFTSAGPVIGDVAISAQGTIYFSSDKLYALNADGTLNVPAVPISPLTGPLVDDLNGFVYVIATSSSGGYDVLRFSEQLQDQSTAYHGNFAFVNPTSPVLGPDGTIYFSDGVRIIAVGSKNWVTNGQPFAGPCFGNPGLLTPTLGRDGSVYSMCQPGGGAGFGSGIYRFDGNTGSQIGFASYSRGGTELLIDNQNEIRAGFQAFDGITFDGSYDAWDVNLNQLTQNSQGDFTTSRSTLMPDGSSTVRISFAFNSSDELSATGAHVWGVVSGPQTLPFFSSVPTVDASGNIFVGTASGVAAMNQSDGSIMWFSSVADTITTQPAISATGSLIAGSNTGKIYAFNSPTSSEWRMQGVNPSRTNVASAKGPKKNPAFAIIASNVLGGLQRIASDGSLIVVDPLENGTFGRVSNYSKTGILKWQQVLNVGGFGLIDVAIATDGTVYASTVDGVTALDANTGTSKWFVNANAGPRKLAIGQDGTIYAGDSIGFVQALTAINPDGTLKWEAFPGSATSVFSGDESVVYLLNSKICCGGLPIGNITSFSTVDGTKINDTPCDPRGDVYVFSQWSVLYSGNINNDLLAFPPDIQSCTTVSANGMIAVGVATTTVTGRIITINNDGTLGGLDQQGNLLWRSTEPLSQAFSSADAVIYAIAPVTHDLVALESEHGAVLWRQHFADSITGQFLADDGNLYLTAGTNLFVSTPEPVLGIISVSTNNANAAFIISDENGHSFNGSGLSFTQPAPSGTYKVIFEPVLGFLTPPPQNGMLETGGAINFTGVYIPIPTLTASSTSLTFLFQQGALGSLEPQTITITSSNAPVLVSAVASTSTISQWLDITPTSATTPAAFVATINPFTLQPGIYNGTIIISAASPSNIPAPVPVQLIISPPTNGRNDPPPSHPGPGGPGPRPKQLVLIPDSLTNFSVLLESKEITIASSPDQLISNITIENNWNAWYFVSIRGVRSVAQNLPSSFLLGPGASRSFQITFQKGDQISFNADATIAIPPETTQDLEMLSVYGAELLWRALAGGPLPQNVADFALQVGSKANPFIDLAVSASQLNISGVLTAIEKIQQDPFLSTQLTAFGLPILEKVSILASAQRIVRVMEFEINEFIAAKKFPVDTLTLTAVQQ